MSNREKADDLVYIAPPAPETVRRVYVLPRELVKRIHDFGYNHGHPSEVAAVRDLLESALKAKGYEDA